MDPVNNLSKVMQLLERRLAGRATKAGGNVGADFRQDRTDVPISASGPEAVEKVVADRLAALDENSDSFAPIATRIFLDEVLRDEFGDAVWTTNEFQSLLEDIRKEWQNDEEMLGLLRKLAAQGRRAG